MSFLSRKEEFVRVLGVKRAIQCAMPAEFDYMRVSLTISKYNVIPLHV